MAAKFGDKSNYPANALSAWVCIGMSEFPIGASGAVGTADGDSGITLAKSDTGEYALVFPACPKALVHVGLKSAAGTVTEAILLAKSATAGTATIQTSAAGVATEPASGDAIYVFVFSKTRG
jgi:hypothetical protein